MKLITTFLSSVSSAFGVDSFSFSFSCPDIRALPITSFVSANDISPEIEFWKTVKKFSNKKLFKFNNNYKKPKFYPKFKVGEGI